MLQKADIDAVAIVTPSMMHFEQIAKGPHGLCNHAVLP